MRYIMFLFCLLVVPGAAYTQETADPNAWVENFLATNIEDGPVAAHELLLNDSYIGTMREDSVKAVVRNLEYAHEVHGPAIRFEHSRTLNISQSVLMLEYVMLRERGPIFWSFTFYQPLNGWRLMSFTLHDQWNTLSTVRPAD